MLSVLGRDRERTKKISVLKELIDAKSENVDNILDKSRFYIDFFQREYRWETRHIQTLIDDLTGAFLKAYKQGHERKDVKEYPIYFLGSIVLSVSESHNKASIIDGQQRITSITLLLIYLNNAQKQLLSDQQVNINNLIFSDSYGERSFNLIEESRHACMEGLYKDGSYTLTDYDDESVENMVLRYEDIANSFPEEIDHQALPLFINWLIEKVILVKIIAYSDENAYSIFETLNDRGMNLTPSEMLKGYVISRVSDLPRRERLNSLWRNEIAQLHAIDVNADNTFFQAWFRAKFAQDMRPGRAGAGDEDFELIGSRFHNWFKDNHDKKMSLQESNFYDFFTSLLPLFAKWYRVIRQPEQADLTDMPHLDYISEWGIAASLQESLLLAPIIETDTEDTIKRKIDLTAAAIEMYTVRRSVNFKRFSQSSIKYTMFSLIKKIRNNSVEE